MIRAIRQLLTCYWAASRLERYLDADPAAPLSPEEVARLQGHVATCERCAEVEAQHLLVHRALSRWSGRRPVDPATVDRMRAVLDDLIDGRRA